MVAEEELLRASIFRHLAWLTTPIKPTQSRRALIYLATF